MPIRPAKSVRRVLLSTLYQAYFEDPLNVLGPEDFLDHEEVDRQGLIANMHYLGDRGLVELKMGYQPPLFASARITADGIDLVENKSEFELRFPPQMSAAELTVVSVPYIIERLVEEAELAPLDGEARCALLRDVQFLREEIARPANRWRADVIEKVIGWVDAYASDLDDGLASLKSLRTALAEAGVFYAK